MGLLELRLLEEGSLPELTPRRRLEKEEPKSLWRVRSRHLEDGRKSSDTDEPEKPVQDWGILSSIPIDAREQAHAQTHGMTSNQRNPSVSWERMSLEGPH